MFAVKSTPDMSAVARWHVSPADFFSFFNGIFDVLVWVLRSLQSTITYLIKCLRMSTVGRLNGFFVIKNSERTLQFVIGTASTPHVVFLLVAIRLCAANTPSSCVTEAR